MILNYIFNEKFLLVGVFNYLYRRCLIMRDLFSWLIGGRKRGNSQKDQIINLKVVSRKLTRSKQKVENQKKKN